MSSVPPGHRTCNRRKGDGHGNREVRRWHARCLRGRRRWPCARCRRGRVVHWPGVRRTGDLRQRFTVVTCDRRGRGDGGDTGRSGQEEPPLRPSAVPERAGPHHGGTGGDMSPAGARETATPTQRRGPGPASAAAPMVVLDALVVCTAVAAIAVHTPPDLTLAALRR